MIAKHALLKQAALLVICGLGFGMGAFGAPADIQSIQANLESVRKTAPIIRIRYKGKIRIIKGSMNEVSDPSRASEVGASIPNEDIVFETSKELICDFPRNRSWCKGTDWAVATKKDAGGTDRAFGYLRFAEGANNETELTCLSPKERIDPRSMSPGIKVPAEFSHFKLTADGPTPEFDFAVYPIYLSQGCLPAPDQAITAKLFLPAFNPEKWRVSGTTVLEGRELPVLVSSPDSAAGHYEYVLRPDLSYVPCRWTRYYEGVPLQIVTIAYDAVSSRPTLRGWTFQEYGTPGVLGREEIYTVESVNTLNSVDDSLFRISPKKGMIALDLNHQDFRVVGADSVRFSTNYEANDYLGRGKRVSAWGRVLIASSIVAAGIMVVTFWIRRRGKK
jgi:hypothetical protein